MAVLATGAKAQDNIEASAMLHESIVKKNVFPPDMCNKVLFIQSLKAGGDLTSQSSVYHQKKKHQNVFNRAIAYTCYELAYDILNIYAQDLDRESISRLVNDPNRVLSTSPLKRTINKDQLVLFNLLVKEFPVRYNLSEIIRKIGNKNRAEIARTLIEIGKINSLNDIHSGLKGAVKKNNPEVLEVFLEADLAPLSNKNLAKLKSLARSQEVQDLLERYSK